MCKIDWKRKDRRYSLVQENKVNLLSGCVISHWRGPIVGCRKCRQRRSLEEHHLSSRPCPSVTKGNREWIENDERAIDRTYSHCTRVVHRDTIHWVLRKLMQSFSRRSMDIRIGRFQIFHQRCYGMVLAECLSIVAPFATLSDRFCQVSTKNIFRLSTGQR